MRWIIGLFALAFAYSYIPTAAKADDPHQLYLDAVALSKQVIMTRAAYTLIVTNPNVSEIDREQAKALLPKLDKSLATLAWTIGQYEAKFGILANRQ